MHKHFMNYLINLRINFIETEIDYYEERLIEKDEELKIVWNTRWGSFREFKEALNGANNQKIRIIAEQIKLLDSIGDLLRR